MENIDRRTMLCAMAAAVLVATTRAWPAAADTALPVVPASHVRTPGGVLTGLPDGAIGWP